MLTVDCKADNMHTYMERIDQTRLPRHQFEKEYIYWMILTILVKGRSIPGATPFCFFNKERSPQPFLNFGSGDRSGLAHGWFVHKVEAAVMNMGKVGVATGTEFETQKVFKVDMQRLGILVRYLLDRTRGGDTTDHNGDGIRIGIAAASWIVIIVWAAQSTTALQPTLMVTTNSNIGNGFKGRNGQTRLGEGVTVRFCNNLVEKVAVGWRHFVGKTKQGKLSFRDGFIGVCRFDGSLAVQSTVFHKGEGAILGTSKVGETRLAETVTQILLKGLMKACNVGGLGGPESILVVLDFDLSVDKGCFFIVLFIFSCPPKRVGWNGRKSTSVQSGNFLPSLVQSQGVVVCGDGLLGHVLDFLGANHIVKTSNDNSGIVGFGGGTVQEAPNRGAEIKLGRGRRRKERRKGKDRDLHVSFVLLLSFKLPVLDLWLLEIVSSIHLEKRTGG